MKNYILLVMFISLFIYACDNDDNNKGHIDPVSSVECIPFIWFRRIELDESNRCQLLLYIDFL